MFSLNPSSLPSSLHSFLPYLFMWSQGRGAGKKIQVRDPDSQRGLFHVFFFFQLCFFSLSFMCLHSSAFPLSQQCFHSISLPPLYLSPSLSPSESKIPDLFCSLISDAHFHRRCAVGSHLMVLCVYIRFQLKLNISLLRLRICACDADNMGNGMLRCIL